VTIASSKTKTATWRRWVSDASTALAARVTVNEADIVTAEADIDELEVLVGTDATDVGVIPEYIYYHADLSTQTINLTTERAEHTITLSAMPAHWNSWLIRGILSVQGDEVAANAVSAVDSRIRLDTVGGTLIGRVRHRMSETSGGATEASFCYNFYYASSTTDPVVLVHTGFCSGSGNDEDYRFIYGKIRVELERLT
jgi:hypothetical protein